MGNDGHGRDQPQMGSDKESSGDQDAIAEVVDAVAHQHAPAATAGLFGIKAVVVMVVIVLMVVPWRYNSAFPAGKNINPPSRSGTKPGVAVLTQRLPGSTCNKAVPQQHARRQAHEVPNNQRQQGLGYRCSQGHRDHAPKRSATMCKSESWCDLSNAVNTYATLNCHSEVGQSGYGYRHPASSAESAAGLEASRFPQLLASIDMGSNSFRLEIAELHKGRYKRVDYLKGNRAPGCRSG